MRRHRFTLIEIVSVLVIIAVSGVGCTQGRKNTADEKLAAQTEQAAKEANAQIGMPAIENFQERKLAKMIFELRDKEGLACYAYIVNKMQGKLVFVGKCIGYGLPYSVQYTSPSKIVRQSYAGAVSKWKMPQADPNQLYMPSGLSATWLMMVDPKTGDPRPVYFEPEIVVSPFPLHK